MKTHRLLAAPALAAAAAASAETLVLTGDDGLAAEAQFTLVDDTTLEVRLRNTSTGAPAWFDSSDQILTGISWDFGLPGNDPADIAITGGFVVLGPDSYSLGFDAGDFGPGDDVSGEFGYGNDGTTDMFANMLTVNQSHATPFGGDNLDGPPVLGGPQGGLVADPLVLSLGGQGAIQTEVVATLYLSDNLTDLSFLQDNPVRVEFGSDAAFLTVPAPGAATLLGLGAMLRRRQRV
jgi:hypothetical protein